jgi:hypothetical protein
MKQLPMTPLLSDLIHKAVGPDVETGKLAVFEAIALNNKPLPGKNGTIFEKAVVEPLTLAQMVDHINSGKTLPLIADHELFGAPMGRVFHAGLDTGEDGEVEMRVLFYLDESETNLIVKLNAGTLDEVSVSFLSSAFLCSECGWDYFSFGTSENLGTRTCANGHTIGTDGVHAQMVGLNQFIELSVVARGAADNPKIIGKSASKLAPETTYRLAAKGFEPNALVVRASMQTKEENNMADPNPLTADLMAEVRKTATLTVEKSMLETNLTAVQGEVTTLKASVADLTTQLAAANEKNVVPEDYEPAKADLSAALAYLGAQYDHLTVASGKPKVEGDARPKTVADFTTKIDEMTGKLTSIIPVGGKSEAAGGGASDDVKPAVKTQLAFKVRN